MSTTPEPTAKIIVLGNSDVGKTSLLLRFCQHTFYEQVKSTIGKPSSNLLLFSFQ